MAFVRSTLSIPLFSSCIRSSVQIPTDQEASSPILQQGLYSSRILTVPADSSSSGYGNPQMGRAPPRAYDEYLKAYSVAMLPGKERLNLSYGGKSTRPPSET